MAFLITKELIFWLPNFGIYFHFSPSLNILICNLVFDKVQFERETEALLP